jgi:hypothetical protein
MHDDHSENVSRANWKSSISLGAAIGMADSGTIFLGMLPLEDVEWR